MNLSIDAEHVHRLLMEFGKEHGFPDLRFSDEGTCALDHPAGITLILEHSPDAATLHWYSRICAIPSDNREAFYSRLLQTNLPGLKTKGASIGIDPSSNDVLLSYIFATQDLDLVRMSNITDNFLESALDLLAELEENIDEPATEGARNDPSFDNGMLQFKV